MPSLVHPVSQLCTQSQFEEPAYRRWVKGMPSYHRKAWEFAYILRVLDVADLLKPGMRGLGFGVGKEPLSAMFAMMGADATASDAPEGGLWAETNQHVTRLGALTWEGICEWAVFKKQVSFRQVDMTAIPDDLVGYDFVWSAGSLEHLGSLEAGIDYIWRSLDCLRPGGIAVHTSEYNLSSNERTIEAGDVVVYRQQDIELLANELRKEGYNITLDLKRGDGEYDMMVDKPPYRNTPHIAIWFDGFTITSLGLSIRKAEEHGNRIAA